MSKTVNVNVKHITRVEGHGNIVVNASDGRVEKVQWQIPEAPRFFEAMVRGHSYEDIQIIVSRICGICSITHSFAATKAIEKAMDIEVSEQTDMIRILMHYSEQLQSHILHIGYLAAPDFFGVKSALGLVANEADIVKTIIKIHRTANSWSELIAGRPTHPITILPGGFTRIPNEEQFRLLQERLKETLCDLETVAGRLVKITELLPKFERDTEYVSLKQDNPPTYSFYHGDIISTDSNGQTLPVDNWRDATKEYVIEQSTAKWARWHRESYAVGALARFNNNAELLLAGAKKAAAMFSLKKGNCNPFMNTIVQIVECFQVVEAGIEIIDKLLTRGLNNEKVKARPKAGKATGCVEAPRGILFHEYEFDGRGRCIGADMCIPTNQNHANIQRDFEEFIPQILEEGEDAVRRKLEMLVRAYDPCISCSTHMLNVQFIR